MKAEKNKAFTLVELLTALAIVAILIGLLMPALGEVRKYAGNVRQKAQIGAIEIGLNLYKNDFGQYPPSHGYGDTFFTNDYNDYTYSGSQTLAEAMVGYDLFGVHPDTVYSADGCDNSSPTPLLLYTADPNTKLLAKRKGPYLDRANIGVFRASQVFNAITSLNSARYMICDTFTTQNKRINGKRYKIGTPVLYFRANASALNTQLIPDSSGWAPHQNNIYNYFDNYGVIKTGRLPTNGEKDHKFFEATAPFPDGSTFYHYISDPMIPPSATPVGNCGRPVKPDSFILISAGADGIYGTKDDICNFEPNI
jgi:prepilin-type N-terminal cleavage/methylation domain-containing protein